MMIEDKQFAALFKESITSDYADALLFMNANPDVSLFKFRKVLESLCLLYGEHYNYKFESNALFDQIEVLAEQEFISGVNKESFHAVRILTNEGVHIERNGNRNNGLTCSKDELLNNAVDARKGVLNLLEHAFLDLRIGKELPKYEMVFAGGQEQKDLWYTCLYSIDYKDHFSLGRIYQELAEGYERLALENDKYATWPRSTFIFAGECYKSAFKFCSGKYVDSIIETKGKDISVTPDSYESLFSFALLCLQGKIESKGKADAQIMLQALVNRGYKDAYAYLGWIYYLDEDYKRAHKYLVHKKVDLNIYTYHKLGVLYLEGKAYSIDIDAAIDNFTKAAELGCSESMFELGRLYHDSKLVKQNEALAQEYLYKSIARDNRKALVYFEDQYLKLKDSFLKISEQILGCINTEEQKIKQKPQIVGIKVGRNELCPCGSEKKYKVCCLH